MTTKLKTMDECIEDGIRLLDEKRPGWVEKIDLSRFDIRSQCGCIVGQVDGHFFDGIVSLGIFGPRTPMLAKWATTAISASIPYGFSGQIGDCVNSSVEEFRPTELQEAWVRRLIQLKAERGIA